MLTPWEAKQEEPSRGFGGQDWAKGMVSERQSDTRSCLASIAFEHSKLVWACVNSYP